MHGISHYSLLACTLSGLFACIGALHLLGPRFVRNAYDRWEYSQALRFIVGFLEIIAAAWLADPAHRGWGIGLAAIINFGAVVTLLNHSQYLQALPAIVMMAALVPATLAVPRTPLPVRFVVPAEAGLVPRQAVLEVASPVPKERSAGS